MKMPVFRIAGVLLLAAVLCGCTAQSDKVVMPANPEPPPKEGPQAYGARPYVPLSSEDPAAPEK